MSLKSSFKDVKFNCISWFIFCDRWANAKIRFFMFLWGMGFETYINVFFSFLVGVDIFHTNKEGVLFNLRETKQVLKNGTETVREFEHSVWEKMVWNETPISALRRWIHDVLSVDNFVDIRKGTQNRLSKASTSYPNLSVLYNRFWFTAKLNNDQFKSKWYTEVKKDKTTYFEWNIVEVVIEEEKK